jgi:hypothetical protein
MKITQDHLDTPHTDRTGPQLAGRINTIRHLQAVAASLSAQYLWTAEFDGGLTDAAVTNAAAFAAGESMTFDILKNGVSVLTAVATLSSTTGKHVRASLDPDKTGFAKGDVFTCTRVYTAGGGPTPATNTTVILEPSYKAVRK